MLSLDLVQSTVKAQLETASYLSGITVTLDDGSAEKEKEAADALEAKGVSIVVWPIESTRNTTAGDAGIFEFDADVPVLFRIDTNRNNPTKNSGAANKEMMALLKAGIQAVLVYRGAVKNPRDLFALADNEPLMLDTFDEGLFCYRVIFTKRCVL